MLANVWKSRCLGKSPYLGSTTIRSSVNSANPRFRVFHATTSRSGGQAAILLEKLIRRRAHSDHWVLVAPDGIVARQSTCTIAVDDPLITEAISHIQSRIGRPFGAEEIAREVPLSRRRFEARFCQAVGRSPYAFINDLRVERAKSLLENHPRLPLTEIAKACGFSGPRRFRLVFQRTTGLPPRQWPNAPLLERQSRELRQTA